MDPNPTFAISHRDSEGTYNLEFYPLAIKLDRSDLLAEGVR